jgi:hypothetical protein
MIKRTASFAELHEAIQDACGWYNTHLFWFMSGKSILVGLPDPDDDIPAADARVEPIDKVLGTRKGKKILYVYDFGDNWEHDVEVVAVDREWPEEFGRQLLDGERAFPPEDCGGRQDYERCCKVATGKLKDPDRLEWLDGWHPERVDLKEIARLFYQAKLFLRADYEEQP